MLIHLMEARDTTTEALAEVIGSLEIALQIVNGDRTISKTQAKRLQADYFNVDISCSPLTLYNNTLLKPAFRIEAEI